MFSPALREFIELWVGANVATGNEDRGHASRNPYRRLADDIEALSSAMKAAIDTAGHSLPSAVGREFVDAMKTFVDDGGHNHLEDFARELRNIGRRQTERSIQLAESKYQILLEFIFMNIELALIAVLAVFTGGTSMTQIAVVRSRTALSILLILQRMGHAVPTPLSALLEAIQEAFITFAAQVISMTVPEEDRRRTDFDWTDIGKSAAMGAIAGALGGLFSEVTAPLFKSFFKRHPVWKEVYELPHTFINEGQAETFAETLTNFFFHGTFAINPATFLSAGISGALFEGASDVAEYGGKWAHKNFFPELDVGQNDLNYQAGSGGSGHGADSNPPTPWKPINAGSDGYATTVYSAPANYYSDPPPQLNTVSQYESWDVPEPSGSVVDDVDGNDYAPIQTANGPGPGPYVAPYRPDSDGSAPFISDSSSDSGSDADSVFDSRSDASSVTDYDSDDDVYEQQGPVPGTGPGAANGLGAGGAGGAVKYTPSPSNYDGEYSNFAGEDATTGDLPGDASRDSIISALNPLDAGGPGTNPSADALSNIPAQAVSSAPSSLPTHSSGTSHYPDPDSLLVDDEGRAVDEERALDPDEALAGDPRSASQGPDAAESNAGRPAAGAGGSNNSAAEEFERQRTADGEALEPTAGDLEADEDADALSSLPTRAENTAPDAASRQSPDLNTQAKGHQTGDGTTPATRTASGPGAGEQAGSDLVTEVVDPDDIVLTPTAPAVAADLTPAPHRAVVGPQPPPLGQVTAPESGVLPEEISYAADESAESATATQLPAPVGTTTAGIPGVGFRAGDAQGASPQQRLSGSPDDADGLPQAREETPPSYRAVRTESEAPPTMSTGSTGSTASTESMVSTGSTGETVTQSEQPAAAQETASDTSVRRVTSAPASDSGEWSDGPDSTPVPMSAAAAAPTAGQGRGVGRGAGLDGSKVWRSPRPVALGAPLDPGPAVGTVPVLPKLTRVSFGDGSSELSGAERAATVRLVLRTVTVAVRNHRGGLRPPEIVVTGYGDGLPELGRQRAEALSDVFGSELDPALAALQADLPTAERLTARDLSVQVVSRDRETGPDAPADDGLQRRAKIEFLDPDPDGSAALATLDALRLREPRLADGPFDANALVRRILHLPDSAPVDTAARAELVALVRDAAAAGRASSLVALGAYHLRTAGGSAASGRFAVNGDEAYPSLNLTGASGEVDTSEIRTFSDEVPLGRTESAPWHVDGDPAPYLVGGSTGGHDHVMVPWPDGSQRRESSEELAERLAHDPDIPEGVPIVLAFPHSGSRGLDLPRLVAQRTGRVVWSFSGQAGVSPVGGNRRAIAMLEIPGRPFGDWIRSVPGEWRAPEPGVPEWERRWLTQSVTGHDHKHLGRASFQPHDLAGAREETLRHLADMRLLGHYNPVTKQWDGEPEALPGPSADYTYAGHGGPGFQVAAQDDGTDAMVPSREFARGLARRPSVSNLREDATIYADPCWAAAASDRAPDRADAQEGAPAPFVADPLENVPSGQHMANETNRHVVAGDRITAMSTSRNGSSTRYFHELLTDVRGRRGQRLHFRPEPKAAALDERARIAGLHSGTGEPSAEVRRRTLRLVRALRLALGSDVDLDPQSERYQVLLRGIGALEGMWRAETGLSANAPSFTMDLFERVTRSRSGVAAGEPVTAEAYGDVLADAATAWERRPGRVLYEDGKPPPLAMAAERLAALRDPEGTARQVLGLPDGAPVGEAEYTKLFWAMVKASEAFAGMPDRDAFGARVLHLDKPDRGRREHLFYAVAAAAAAGRQVSDVDAVAAFQLERDFLPLQVAVGGKPSVRNWAGLDMPGGVDTARITLSGSDTEAPWQVKGGPRPVVVAVEPLGDGRLALTNAAGVRRVVTEDELGELLAHDRSVYGHGLDTPLVLAASELGRRHPDLPDKLKVRLGRAIWFTDNSIEWSGLGVQDPAVIGHTGDPAAKGNWHVARPAAAQTSSVSRVTSAPRPEWVPADPVLPSLTRREFAEGAETVSAGQRKRIRTLVSSVAEVGARNVLAGIPAPRVVVTGYDDAGRGSDSGAAGRRADAVAEVFRAGLRQPGAADAFTVTTSGAASAADTGEGVARQVTVGIELWSHAAAVERLDVLRKTDPALSEVPFDPVPLARRILHLGASDPVDAAVREELYTLVGDAMAAGRATDLAALGAFHLVERGGALSAARRITDAAGKVRGLDWLGGPPVKGMDANGFVVTRDGRVEVSRTWNAGQVGPFVIAARGGRDYVDLPWPGGSTRRVPMDEIVELLGMDEELGQYPAAQPALLVWSHAGDGGLEMPRAVSARTGRMVGAHRGAVVLSHPGPG
ncbi:MAG TPA: lonely Cys domain-containing protein, partial [Streptomyces sp.]|nr:lonely Cys domain-containing protein [Streptomyces sp.]